MTKFLILLVIKMGFAFMAMSLLYSFILSKQSDLLENHLPDLKATISASKFANALDAYDKGNYGAAYSEFVKAFGEVDASEALQGQLEEMYADRHNRQVSRLADLCVASGGSESSCDD